VSLFALCNICAILRRKVIYLYSKKHHLGLDQLFHCQMFGIWCHKMNCKSVFFVTNIRLFRHHIQKIWQWKSCHDQDEVFHYKGILQFFLEWLKYYRLRSKITFGVRPTLIRNKSDLFIKALIFCWLDCWCWLYIEQNLVYHIVYLYSNLSLEICFRKQIFTVKL
jgi:hypothetical protein